MELMMFEFLGLFSGANAAVFTLQNRCRNTISYGQGSNPGQENLN